MSLNALQRSSRYSQLTLLWVLVSLCCVYPLSACSLESSNVPPPDAQTSAPTCAPPPFATPSQVRLVAGTGAALPLMRALAAAYAQDRSGVPPLRIPKSIGTQGALRALRDGAIQAGLGSRMLSDEERGSDIYEELIARCPLVFVTHPSTPEHHLNTAEIAALYRGERAQWDDTTPVVALLREDGDSGLRALEMQSPEIFQATQHARTHHPIILTTDQEMRDELLQTPGSIGFLGLDVIRLETLPLRQIHPEDARETPITRPLTLLMRKDSPSVLSAFLHFLESDRAADVIRSAGCTPLWKRPDHAF